MSRWRVLLSEPLLHFVLLGALLFIAYRQFHAPALTPVTLSEAGMQVLVADFEILAGRLPDADERQQLIADYYRGEVLFREALRRDLPATDPTLRGVLIEHMQRQVTGSPPEPKPQDAVAFYADHIERYYSEATLSLQQYFLRQAPTDAAAMLGALRAEEAAEGDLPPEGARLPDYGVSMLRALFGAQALQALQEAPMGQWIGPYRSLRGWHYFRVEGRRDPQLLPFEAVRTQVVTDMQAAALEKQVDDFVDAVRERYPLRRLP